MEDQNVALQFKELTPSEMELLSSLYEGKPQPCVRVGPKGYFFTKEYTKHAADIYNMELKEGDVFVTSYQRSGTTLTQELVWLILNNLDYEKAKSISLRQRYAYLELVCIYDDNALKYLRESDTTGNTEKVQQVQNFLTTPATKILATMPSPRFVKTHLPISLLPPKLLDTAKVVYLARDPRDVAVSNYHLAKFFRIKRLKASFKEMWNAFIKDLFILTPYFETVKEAWALRNHPNMLFLFYEDILKDLPGSIRLVADFLGKELTPGQIERLCDHLNIKNFKNNKSVNFEDFRGTGFLDSNETFIRTGKSGGWQDYFDEEMVRDAERWIADNLRDTDLRFPTMNN